MQAFLTDTPAMRHDGALQALRAWLARGEILAVSGREQPLAILAAEARLVDAARNGDQDAFRQIIDRFQTSLATQMGRFSRDRAVVEELVHDVFVEAFTGLAGFKGKSPLEHWLRKIAVRVGYRHWKLAAREKQRRELERNEAVSRASLPVTQVAAIDAREQLDFMLSRLSPRDRLVLTLLYWDGYTIAEAAELAGWTHAMVKVQAHRARKRLKKLLQESDER